MTPAEPVHGSGVYEHLPVSPKPPAMAPLFFSRRSTALPKRLASIRRCFRWYAKKPDGCARGSESVASALRMAANGCELHHMGIAGYHRRGWVVTVRIA